MSEDVEELLDLIKKSSDTTLMLNLISPYLVGERRGKLSKINQDLIEVIQTLVVNQMKMQNDFRALLLYLNKKELLEFDNVEIPDFKTVEPDTLYT